MNGTERPDTAEDTSARLAQQLADIARVLLAPGSLSQTLDQIVTLAAATIDGCDEAGLCPHTIGTDGTAATSPLVAELDDLQTSLGEGPCPDAVGGQDSVYVADLTEDARWPRFGPAAVEAGLRSVLTYRLIDGGDTLGALVLYARLPGAFNATDRAQGLIFAAHAGMALEISKAQQSERDRTDNLQAALISRELIGQAQGILMERERVTADQAFDLLRRSSQRLNVKLRDVAQELVDTGSVPGEDPGSST